MQSPNLHEDEFCPSCGRFVALIYEETGWCHSCSGMTPPTPCEKCGDILEDPKSKLCNSCKYMLWLERNANKIERIMVSLGLSAGKAKKVVRSSNRPICACCGNPIKGGQSGKNNFCKKTRACRTGHNSYHYYRSRGYDHITSLNRAIVAATKERLLDEVRTRTANKAA